jgi:uncharacterized protein YdhG (YjbR/CyaY superfamily)
MAEAQDCLGNNAEANEAMKRDIESVDQYLASQPEAARRILSQVRVAIRKAVPKADETIAYKMPAYKLNGERLLYFAGWKQHYSLYPATKRLLMAFKEDLKPYKVVKSTVRFPLTEPVPSKLIERLAKFRAQETREARKG